MIMPNIIYELLNGKNLEAKKNIVFIFQTINIEGYPHTSMLSVGEIIAVDMENIRLALWPNTNTVQGLELNNKANLVFIYLYKVYYIELDINKISSENKDFYDRAKFSGYIRNVKIDEVEYADVTSGISIELHNPNDVLSRWKHTLNNLLKD